MMYIGMLWVAGGALKPGDVIRRACHYGELNLFDRTLITTEVPAISLEVATDGQHGRGVFWPGQTVVCIDGKARGFSRNYEGKVINDSRFHGASVWFLIKRDAPVDATWGEVAP